MAEASGPVAENVVVLVHGIRTYAPWYPLVERLMRPRGISVHPIRYGRFDLFRFMVPGPWRRGPVAATLRKLEPILLDAAKKGQRVTVIAHSNGSYVVTKLLEEKPTIELDYLILCGSVVPNDFDWTRVNRQIRKAIVNDYGVRDIWPVVAKSLSWGFGHAGTHGFGAPVIDRIHDLGHDYFTEEFVERFWLPIIESDEIVASTRRGDRLPSTPLWFAIGELPWRWAILAAIGVAVALALAIVWPALRSLAPGGTPPINSTDVQNSSMPARRTSPLQRDALGVNTEFRFSANGSWLPVSLYQGSPQPVFGTDPQAIFSAEEAGEDSSVSSGQEEPRFAEAFAINGVDVLDPGTRSSVMRCLVSVDALARCPVDTKAGAFTALAVNSGYASGPEGLLPDDLAAIRSGLAGLPYRRVPATATPPQLRISIRNKTSESHLVTAIRFELMAIHVAEGDGTKLDQPIVMHDVDGGTLRLADMLRLDCKRANARPVAEVRMPNAVGLQPKAFAPIVLNIDPVLRRRFFGDEVYALSMGQPDDADPAQVCRNAVEDRGRERADLPEQWKSAFRKVTQPIYTDAFVATAKISLQVDGEWVEVGLVNFFLP